MNYIKSTICFPHGHLKDIPESIPSIKGSRLNKLNNNTIELVFHFSENHDKKKALNIVQDTAELYANLLSLRNKVHNTVNIGFDINWDTIKSDENTGLIMKGMSYGVSLWVVGASEIDFNENFAQSNKFKKSLICYNEALKCFHQNPGDTSSIGIWLRNSWETLQNELKVSEHKLKNLIPTYVLERDKMIRFKFSIGEYYVHKKERDKNRKDPKPLLINECIDSMQNILVYFTEEYK